MADTTNTTNKTNELAPNQGNPQDPVPAFIILDKYNVAKLFNDIGAVGGVLDGKTPKEVYGQAAKEGISTNTVNEILQLNSHEGRKQLLDKLGVNEKTGDDYRLAIYALPDHSTGTLFKGTIVDNKLTLNEIGASPALDMVGGSPTGSIGLLQQALISETTRFESIPPITVALTTNSINSVKDSKEDFLAPDIQTVSVPPEEAIKLSNKVALASALSKGTDTPLDFQGAVKPGEHVREVSR